MPDQTSPAETLLSVIVDALCDQVPTHVANDLRAALEAWRSPAPTPTPPVTVQPITAPAPVTQPAGPTPEVSALPPTIG